MGHEQVRERNHDTFAMFVNKQQDIVNLGFDCCEVGDTDAGHPITA